MRSQPSGRTLPSGSATNAEGFSGARFGAVAVAEPVAVAGWVAAGDAAASAKAADAARTTATSGARRSRDSSELDVFDIDSPPRSDAVAGERLMDLEQVAGRVAEVGDPQHPVGPILRLLLDARAAPLQLGERLVDVRHQEREDHSARPAI